MTQDQLDEIKDRALSNKPKGVQKSKELEEIILEAWDALNENDEEECWSILSAARDKIMGY